MSALGIILGRHGSKGLAHKNVAPVGGKPCVAWTIEAALASESLDHTVVSTDPGPITDVASSYSVPVLERPAALASDHATVDDAARHALQALDEDPVLAGIDSIVLLYANVPVRPAGLIDRSIGVLLDTGCDSVQSYKPAGKHHPWWTAVVSESDASVRAFDHGELNHGTYRRQDLPPAHIPDGGVIALTRNALTKSIKGVTDGPHAFFGLDRRGVLTGEGEVIDIDSEIDLLVADAILSRQPATTA
ncbi:MAG: acylneuraminate cytidylyltransferase family protein [Planctomycetota bacterium]